MHADATPVPQRTLNSGRALLRMFEYVLKVASAPLVRMNRNVSGSAAHRGDVADRRPHRGRVTLVGAGPGDPELLTIKAACAIESADIILFDALVSDAILRLASPHACLLYTSPSPRDS